MIFRPLHSAAEHFDDQFPRARKSKVAAVMPLAGLSSRRMQSSPAYLGGDRCPPTHIIAVDPDYAELVNADAP